VDVNGYAGQQAIAAGTRGNLRLDQQGGVVTSMLHGRYYEQARNGNVFFAANQAATAVSVALATTYTGLCLSNPAGNTKNLVLLKVNFALSVAPAAIAPIGLIGGYLSTGIVTHTTALAASSTTIGTGPAATAKADGAATLVGTPMWIHPMQGGFTAAALPSSAPALLDMEGSIIIPPGAYVAIGALTAVTGFGGMIWEEVPIIS
jgi:hypothetical protein